MKCIHFSEISILKQGAESLKDLAYEILQWAVTWANIS